ncbi:transporter substrate-binding domain-containing protein [Bradyrhizobium diversitatis]|uniref:Transporter substrate-binding domain-containing protein n=1 Tax=Bradyrhizobium diversitatis TaxID=2755406 RepID=A0ABS0PFT7_9BRAD|nr:transporter substrate-binding domain-containing protein [Bradyrhizobium diversitatis]MBH5392167.1 transporter substrate-binding domain-containing protein [Bradyrhizobium diversitatis]
MRKTQSLSLLVVLLTSAGNSSEAFAQADDSFVGSLRKAGVVKAAVASVPPLIAISPTGKTTGYMADITNLALQGMGLPELTPSLIDYSAMIPALQARQVDLVVPVLQASEEKCKAVLYSAPVFLNRNVLFVKAGNPKHLTSLAQIATMPEVRVAVTSGGQPEALALKAGVKREQFVYAPDNQAGISTVIGGRANAYVAGQFSFSISKLKQLGLDVVVDPQSPVILYGVVVRKEDVGFRDALSHQINILRGNGKMREAFIKWAAEADVADEIVAATWKTLSNVQKLSEVVPGCE